MAIVPKKIHKYNNGRFATLCNSCHTIITEGRTEDLFCNECTYLVEAIKESGEELSHRNLTIAKLALSIIKKNKNENNI